MLENTKINLNTIERLNTRKAMKIKVGDLVRCMPTNDIIIYHDYGPGIVLALSKTGHTSFSAKVKFLDDTLRPMWFDSKELEVISEIG